MSYKTSTSDGEIDLTCSRCGIHQMERLARRGFLQRRIYPLFGYYPWECPQCRDLVMLKLRFKTHRRHRHRHAHSES